ncbi:cytochrome P450 [Artomyces pyxidatus]|uniref:Cytochrome P450 n=1 Tax=Artomyces pyxidatus TaxID=48021 RepID=A0ACB8T7I6_9AGAM|nr:cytochrome P450 [Artomyces pyxidatus]
MNLELPNHPLTGNVWLASLTVISLGILVVKLCSLGGHRVRQMVLWDLPGPPSPSFFAGNYLQMFDPVTGIDFREYVRRTYGIVTRFSGPFGDQVLLISDPKALSNILLKYQETFEEIEWFTETFRHFLGPELLSSTGASHRRQRKILNPAFQMQHLRSMVPLFHKITYEFRKVMRKKLEDDPQEIELMDWLGRLSLEMIAQGGLGYTFESFTPDAENAEFVTAIKDFAPVLARVNAFLLFFPLVSKWPGQLLRYAAVCLQWGDVNHVVKIADTIHLGMSRLFETKKALLAKGDAELTDQILGGRDIVSVLMRTDSKDAEFKMRDDEITAQMTTLLAAGTDTTSTALSRMVYLFTQHQDVQERLRQELNAAVASSGEDFTAEELSELPYLNAVCLELLRLHAPVSFVARTCHADTTIALSQPIPGVTTSQSSMFIPRNTTVIVDILGVNRNYDIWGADADEFKPERWLSPLPESVVNARIPGISPNMLTFLGGWRSCIGFKLAELEIRVVLSHLVRAFRFLPSKEIEWRLGPVTTPHVKGSPDVTPMMPIILESLLDN